MPYNNSEYCSSGIGGTGEALRLYCSPLICSLGSLIANNLTANVGTTTEQLGLHTWLSNYWKNLKKRGRWTLAVRCLWDLCSFWVSKRSLFFWFLSLEPLLPHKTKSGVEISTGLQRFVPAQEVFSLSQMEFPRIGLQRLRSCHSGTLGPDIRIVAQSRMRGPLRLMECLRRWSLHEADLCDSNKANLEGEADR